MNKKGFTLIELLAVIALISILVIIMIPNFLSTRESGVNTIVKAKIATIETRAEKQAEADINTYQICTGTIHINNDAQRDCIFAANDILTKSEQDEKITGNAFICFDNQSLKVKAHYSTEDSYNCS